MVGNVWGDNSFTISSTDARVVPIFQLNPSTNYDALTHTYIGREWTGQQWRILIDFDDLDDSLGVLEDTVTFDSAFLGLTGYEYGTPMVGDSIFITTHTLTRAFVDLDATWNEASSGVSWTSAGGDYSATREKFGSYPDSLKIDATYGNDDTLWIPISGASITDTLNGGLGLIVLPMYYSGGDVRWHYHTDDYGTAAYRPFLKVFHDGEPPGEPEPPDDPSPHVDLTPSVNYFGYDYGTVETSDAVDSTVANRYEALVADVGYSAGYNTKWNEYWAWDSTLELGPYVDGTHLYTSTGGVDAGTIMGPEMGDSTDMFFHSIDSVLIDTTTTLWLDDVAYDNTPANVCDVCGGCVDSTNTSGCDSVQITGWRLPYSESEEGSRLLAYTSHSAGARTVPNYCSDEFVDIWVDYYLDTLMGLHPTRDWTFSFVFFDNRSGGYPITDHGVSICPSGRGRLMEADVYGVGWDSLYGCEAQSDYFTRVRDTNYIRWMGELRDTMFARRGVTLVLNSGGWGGYTKDASVYEYHPEYYDPETIRPVHRAREFCCSPFNDGMFYPGPSSGASSIDSATVAATYDPIVLYADNVIAGDSGAQHWYNPGTAVRMADDYGYKDHWYHSLASYYLWRSNTTYISFSNDLAGDGRGTLNWLDGGGSDGRCVHAGEAGDTCYWIGALGVRLGRDGGTGWQDDVVRYYNASVTCSHCIETTGIGKDSNDDNWVTFSRQWTGDDNYEYLILCRPDHGYIDWVSTDTWSPVFDLPEGNWSKLDYDGDWSSETNTTDSLMNGEGAIYRQATEATARHIKGFKP